MQQCSSHQLGFCLHHVVVPVAVGPEVRPARIRISGGGQPAGSWLSACREADDVVGRSHCETRLGAW